MDIFQVIKKHIRKKLVHVTLFDLDLRIQFCYHFQIQGYTKAVEEFIEEELEKRIPEFNMRSFIQGKYFFIHQK